MGFALTIVYIVVTIISPEQFGPQWANYHALMYLAGITAIASLPSLTTYQYWKSSVQTYLLLGFVVAIALSQLAHGYLGGVIISLRTFLPAGAVFLFIIVNVTTVRRLKIVTLATVASCLVLTVEALCGYYGGYKGELFIFRNTVYNLQDDVIGQIIRIRGAGFLNDPNDFAQILLIVLPLTFFAWRRGRSGINFFLVILPSALLLWTVYLTHSRGALITLAAVALLTARKKLGTTTSAVLAALLIFGMLALDFTGGRGISAADGADRLEAWANGLEMFKSAPIFGIGFGNFTDLYQITAHNSFVLCLAELGVLGSILWVGLLVTTMMGLNRIVWGKRSNLGRPFFGLFELFEMNFIRPAVNAAEPVAAFSHGSVALENAYASEMLPAAEAVIPATPPGASPAIEPNAEQTRFSVVPRQWVLIMRLALVSFLATSWFLSRSYTITMYLVLGLATATIALENRDNESPDRGRWIISILVVEGLMILLIYLLVRLRH